MSKEVNILEASIKTGDRNFKIHHNLSRGQVKKFIAELIKTIIPQEHSNQYVRDEELILLTVNKLISNLSNIKQEEINSLIVKKVFKD